MKSSALRRFRLFERTHRFSSLILRAADAESAGQPSTQFTRAAHQLTKPFEPTTHLRLPDDPLLPDHSPEQQISEADDPKSMQFRRLTFMIPLAALAIVGCEAQEHRRAAENAAIKKQASDEITRICALQGAEREAELKKLKAASGMELYCARVER